MEDLLALEIAQDSGEDCDSVEDILNMLRRNDGEITSDQWTFPTNTTIEMVEIILETLLQKGRIYRWDIRKWESCVADDVGGRDGGFEAKVEIVGGDL